MLDAKITEIDQLIFNIESSFHEPIKQEIDTEWSQPNEPTMEHIFVLKKINTPKPTP